MDAMKASFKDVNMEDMLLTSVAVVIVFVVLTRSKYVQFNNFDNHLVNVTMYQSIVSVLFVLIWSMMNYSEIQGVPPVNLGVLMLFLTIAQQILFILFNKTLINKSSSVSTKPSTLQFMWIPFTFLIPLILYVMNQIFDSLVQNEMAGFVFKWIRIDISNPVAVSVLYYLVAELVSVTLYTLYATFAKSSRSSVNMLCGSEDVTNAVNIGSDYYVTTSCIPNIHRDVSMFTSFSKTLALMLLTVSTIKNRNL